MIKTIVLAIFLAVSWICSSPAQTAPAASGQSKAPTSFRWFYLLPPRGWVYASQTGPTHWVLRYADSTEDHHEVLSRTSVLGCQGTLLGKVGHNDIQSFIPDSTCKKQNLMIRVVSPSQSSSNEWTLAGRMERIQYGAPPAAAPIATQPTTPLQAAGAYDLDKDILFNVLDQIEYDPQSGKLALVGHNDPRYGAPRIPYWQYLAALLDNPAPKFSLEWTSDSEHRVEALRLQSDADWRRLAREWGTWIDASGRPTAAGRVFMPLFGISVTESMNRYQVLAAVLSASGRAQAAVIVITLGNIHAAWPHPSREQLVDFITATGTADYAGQLNVQVAQGTLAPTRRDALVFRAIWQNMDSAFGLSSGPLVRTYDAAIANGQSREAAFDTAVAEFNRQIQTVAGNALATLLQSKSEIQIPVSLVNPSLSNTLQVEPRFIGIDGRSLLAKLLFDADQAAKTLVNKPELAATIPAYQTEFAFRRAHPGAGLGSRVSNARLWISVDQIDATRSEDGNILALANAKMRINMRSSGTPDPQLDQYAALLTSLYDDLAQRFSPSLHDLREAGKLAYAAQWLKSRNASLKLPAAGRASWNAPSTARGVIFVAWSPSPASADVMTVSAIGGIDLTAPRPPPQLPANPDVIPVMDLQGATGVRQRTVAMSPSGGDFPKLLEEMVRNAQRLTEQEEEEERQKCDQGAPVVGVSVPEVANWPVRGRYGEAALAYLYPGGNKLTGATVDVTGLPSELGTLERKVDWSWQGKCMEAKEGYITDYSPRVQLEILKDAALRDRGACNEIEWHFFVSPTTKRCGPSANLVKQLKARGFRCVKHDDPRVATSVPDCRPHP